MGVDPVGVDPSNLHSFNRYAYANNNPYKYVDPDGNSPIDVAFLAVDIAKLGVAVYTGTGIGAAAIDVGFSLIGTAIPVPGAGQALKAARAADKAIEVVHANSRLSEKAQHLYEIRNVDTGAVVKTGISSGMISAKGKSVRAQSQISKWKNEGLCDNCASTIIGEIAAGKGARQKVLNIERSNATGLRDAKQLDPNLHRRP